MILVIGSTGKLGSEVCELLKAKNFQTKAMIRKTTPSEKRNKLTTPGLQLIEGDLCDKSNFRKVLENVTTVITTVSSMPFSYAPGQNDITSVDEQGMINLIDAAKMAGVKHFIYTSFSGNLDLDFPLRNAKRKVEAHLQQSGLDYTILRSGYFMESWFSATTGFDAANGKINLYGDGTKPVAYISLKDVAKFAVESIGNPAVKNTILELGGPENLKPIDAVKIFEEVLVKKMDVQFLPREVLQNQLETAPEPMQKSFAGLMCCMADGDFIEMKKVLEKIPVRLTSVKEFAQKSK